MNVLTSRWTYAGLAAFLAGDAVASAIPIRYVAEQMDAMGVPAGLRPLIPVAKATLSAGLASVFARPGLARLTTAVLTLYFAVALGIHARARNRSAKVIPPVLLLGLFAAMTVRGPAPQDRTPGGATRG